MAQASRHLLGNLAAAVAVEQQINFEARLAAFSKTLGKFMSQGAALEKVLGEGDGRFGVFNLAQHRRKDRIAVFQNFDFIAAADGCVGECLDCRKKRSVSEFDVRHIIDGAYFGAAGEQQQDQSEPNYQK